MPIKLADENAAPKLDVADTKLDGDDFFNKLTYEKEVSKPVPGITMDSTVKKENYNQFDDFMEEASAIIFLQFDLAY